MSDRGATLCYAVEPESESESEAWNAFFRLGRGMRVVMGWTNGGLLSMVLCVMRGQGRRGGEGKGFPSRREAFLIRAKEG